MKVLLILFMLATGFYTFSYGYILFKKYKNKLGGGAVIALSVLGTMIPAIELLIR